MATGFLIEIGYISGATTDCDQNEAFSILVDIASKHNITFWEEHIKRLPDTVRIMRDENLSPIVDYCNQYSAERGNPMTILETAVYLSCSGGGQSRKMKEIVAMMFCRILMERMNNYGIPLSITAV